MTIGDDTSSTMMTTSCVASASHTSRSANSRLEHVPFSRMPVSYKRCELEIDVNASHCKDEALASQHPPSPDFAIWMGVPGCKDSGAQPSATAYLPTTERVKNSSSIASGDAENNTNTSTQHNWYPSMKPKELQTNSSTSCDALLSIKVPSHYYSRIL
jgi:hypothetical protein